MNNIHVLDAVVVFLVVAIVYVLVRPRSKGADLVKAISSAVIAVVRSAADLAGGNGG